MTGMEVSTVIFLRARVTVGIAARAVPEGEQELLKRAAQRPCLFQLGRDGLGIAHGCPLGAHPLST